MASVCWLCTYNRTKVFKILYRDYKETASNVPWRRGLRSGSKTEILIFLNHRHHVSHTPRPWFSIIYSDMLFKIVAPEAPHQNLLAPYSITSKSLGLRRETHILTSSFVIS